MRRMISKLLLAALVLCLASCKENYSQGEKDRTDQDSLIALMKQAQVEGWKLKIRYHEVWGFVNFWGNRGETDYFVDAVTVLDKDFANPLKRMGAKEGGKVVDTVYVVIDKNELLKHKKLERN